MPKIAETDFSVSYVSEMHGPCCWCQISAYPPAKEDYPQGELFISTIGWSDDSYWQTLRGRIRSIWWFIKNSGKNSDIQFWERKDAEAFVADLQEAIIVAFPDTICK